MLGSDGRDEVWGEMSDGGRHHTHQMLWPGLQTEDQIQSQQNTRIASMCEVRGGDARKNNNIGLDSGEDEDEERGGSSN